MDSVILFNELQRFEYYRHQWLVKYQFNERYQMNINYLRKQISKVENQDSDTYDYLHQKIRDWRPKWFIQRVTEPQFRDRYGRLLPHPTPTKPPIDNHSRHVLQRAHRMKQRQGISDASS